MLNKKVIAVDLGGTNLRVSLVKGSKILKYVKKKTPKTKKDLINELFNTIEEVMERGVKGIGIGSPGPLENGVIKNTPNLPLKNFDLKSAVSKRFKMKVEVENDANCVALAEINFGCKKKNFFILTLGTGIGGAIVLNGELYKGRGNAGELGHLILDNGKYFEDLAAWKATMKLTQKYLSKNLLAIDLVKLKSLKSEKILQEISMYLGQGIASLINVLDPEVVILSGGMKETGNLFLNKIRKQVRRYIFLLNKTEVNWTKLEHPGVLGASTLI